MLWYPTLCWIRNKLVIGDSEVDFTEAGSAGDGSEEDQDSDRGNLASSLFSVCIFSIYAPVLTSPKYFK